MTAKQVGWYDGERVHQMNARPVGDVPRHLAHTAWWVPVFVEPETLCGSCNGAGEVVALSHGQGPDDYEFGAVCRTCGGFGVIGGFENSAAPGYVTEDCPDCTPRAPITLTPAMKADAALFEGEHFTVFATPQETV